jgi:hypothetical protein
MPIHCYQRVIRQVLGEQTHPLGRQLLFLLLFLCCTAAGTASTPCASWEGHHLHDGPRRKLFIEQKECVMLTAVTKRP